MKKKCLGVLMIIGVFAMSSAMVSASNDYFYFDLSTTCITGVNVKEDTDAAVVNTLSITNPFNLTTYTVVGFNSTTGVKEYATPCYSYLGNNVLGKKSLEYYSGYAWIGANRYLQGIGDYLVPIPYVSGRWAS